MPSDWLFYVLSASNYVLIAFAFRHTESHYLSLSSNISSLKVLVKMNLNNAGTNIRVILPIIRTRQDLLYILLRQYSFWLGPLYTANQRLEAAADNFESLPALE